MIFIVGTNSSSEPGQLVMPKVNHQLNDDDQDDLDDEDSLDDADDGKNNDNIRIINYIQLGAHHLIPGGGLVIKLLF